MNNGPTDPDIYNYEDQRLHSATKRAKRKGKTKKLDSGNTDVTLNFDPPADSDQDDQLGAATSYKNISKKSERRKVNYYSNQGFDAAEDEMIGQHNQYSLTDNPKQRTKKSRTKKHEAEPNENYHTIVTESDVGERSVEQKRTKKKKSKLLIPREEFQTFDEPTDEPKSYKSKKSPKKLTDTLDKYDHQHHSVNETEQDLSTQLPKKKTRRKKIKQDETYQVDNDNFESYQKDTEENNGYLFAVDQFEDTGYESFNKKEHRKEKRHKQKKKRQTEDTQEDPIFEEKRSDILPEEYSGFREEKMQRQKRKKGKTKREEQSDIESTVNSPSVQPKIIKVHGKKSKKREQVPEKNENEESLDDLLDEFNITPKQLTIKYDGKNTHSIETSDTENKFDEVDLELEEMLLPLSSRQRQANESDTKFYSSSKKTNKKQKRGTEVKNENYDELRTTEVVPFKDDSDSEVEFCKKEFTKVKEDDQHMSQSSNPEKNCVHENGAKLPSRMYAFGQDSESEEVSVSESDEELEIPVEKSNKPVISVKSGKPSEKPPKPSRKHGTGAPHAPVLLDSANFDKDTNSDTVDKSKPPR